MDNQELARVIELHGKWISGKHDGIRANLRDANLSRANLRGANLGDADLSGAYLDGADLSGANLSGADLRGANLIGANLGDANLRGANLSGANLSGADLRGADLSGADLRGANLIGANLSGADLRGANLIGANLRGADLSGAYLRDAIGIDLELAISITSICPSGDIIGWKKCNNDVIVKMIIPSDAKRSNGTGRKCRAEFVKVIEVLGAEFGVTNKHGPETVYRVGETVRSDSFDECRWNECSNGIHFFITRYEAEHYI